MKWKAFENNVAKALSAWYFDGDEKVLRRSPCSGGWKARGSDGDIILADDRKEFAEVWPFTVEAKCRAGGSAKDGWHLEQLLTAKKHPILEWWKQLCESKPVVDKKMWRMLVFSKTSGISSSLLVFGDNEVYNIKEKAEQSLLLPAFRFFIDGGQETLWFYSFTDFLQTVNPEALKIVWKEGYGQG